MARLTGCKAASGFTASARWTTAQLLLADAGKFTLGLLARPHFQDHLENLFADRPHRPTFQHHAGIHVHVVGHMLIQRRVGSDLDAWARLAAEDASPAHGENADVGATSDDAGHVHRRSPTPPCRVSFDFRRF